MTAPAWTRKMIVEALEEAQHRARKRRLEFLRYRDDPVKFGEDMFGDRYTEDVKALMRSVAENPITVARSANAVGKTHCAGRIAVWFYLTFPDSQVYATAAPPLENLKNLLWGEILSVYHQRPDLFAADRINTLQLARSPRSFITGVAIPTTGTPEERQSKFCADADDLFELHDGSLARYGDLIGRKDVSVISVNDRLEREWEKAEFFDNGVKQVYEITLEDGEVIRRTENHPLYAGWDIRPDHDTHNRSHGRGRFRVCQEGWVEVRNLKKGYAVLGAEQTDFNFGNQRMDESRLKFLAYMIGDGCFIDKSPHSRRLQFTQERNAQLEEFLGLLDAMGVRYNISDCDNHNWVCVSTTDEGLSAFVEELGLRGCRSENKFIPQMVFTLEKEQVALFLSRLFSTDGHACMCKVHKYNKAEIGYCSKSKQLVFDIQRLLRRFGILCRVKSRIVTWNFNDEQRSDRYWVLSIGHAVDVIRFVEQIGIYGKEEGVAQCRQYAVTRQWSYAGWRFKASGYRWRKIVSIVPVGERPTVGVYVPKNHTYLTSLVEHNSGKHAPNLLFIVDEGDAVPAEVYKGIEGCMSGGNARLLIMFNPKATRGPVYELERMSRAKVVHLSALRHPNVITGQELIPGAVTRETVVRRINEWTRPLVEGETPGELERFEVPDFLVGAVAHSLSGVPYPPLPAGSRVIEEAGFYYMVLGEYPAQGANQLISQDWIDQARSRYDAYVAVHGERPPEGVSPRMGLDVSEYGPDWNVPTLRYGSFVARVPRIWQGVDPTATAEKAAQICERYGVSVVIVDATGVGSGVAPGIAKLRKGTRCISAKFASRPGNWLRTEQGEFYDLRTQLWWAMREWLRTDPNAMLPPEPQLLQELAVPTYEVQGNFVRLMDKDTMREYLKRSPNFADSLALTFLPSDRARVVRLG